MTDWKYPWQKRYYERVLKNNPVHKMKAYEHCKNWRRKQPERLLYSRAKNKALKNGLEFNLEVADIKIPEYCPLLGIKLCNKYINPDCLTDNVPSLDRKDNTKGYTKDNIWIISFKANRMKNTATPIELIQFAKSILKTFNEDIIG